MNRSSRAKSKAASVGGHFIFLICQNLLSSSLISRSISLTPPKRRAALYVDDVDGFNLYHALDALDQPYLKWLNLFALGSRILNRNQEKLVKVRYCTALKPYATDKNKSEYITALKWFNVKVHVGHFVSDNVDCHKCGHVWGSPKEKETDVNIALLLFDDAYQDNGHHATRRR